ncbi:DNA-methyltransferase [Kibdelosporangium philippinense]
MWIGGDPACVHIPDQSRAQRARPSSERAREQRICRKCYAILEDRQYGQESTPQAYIDSLRGVFDQLRRILVDTGVVWLNLGDSYSTHAVTPSSATPGDNGVIPPKSLIGMPWRVAFALQRDGWILRNAVIWHKPNAIPESVRDHLSVRYETLFLLVKQQRYWFDLDAIREPLARLETSNQEVILGSRDRSDRSEIGGTVRQVGLRVYGKYSDPQPFGREGRKPHGAELRLMGRKHDAAHVRGKNPGDVWSISTRPLQDAHFAAFPIDIPLRCVAAGCPPGGLVLDPFSGAATTGLAARQLGRSYIGIDPNPEFHDIGLHRFGLHASRKGRTA